MPGRAATMAAAHARFRSNSSSSPVTRSRLSPAGPGRSRMAAAQDFAASLPCSYRGEAHDGRRGRGDDPNGRRCHGRRACGAFRGDRVRAPGSARLPPGARCDRCRACRPGSRLRRMAALRGRAFSAAAQLSRPRPAHAAGGGARRARPGACRRCARGPAVRARSRRPEPRRRGVRLPLRQTTGVRERVAGRRGGRGRCPIEGGATVARLLGLLDRRTARFASPEPAQPTDGELSRSCS